MNNFSFVVAIATISAQCNSAAMHYPNSFRHSDNEQGKQRVQKIRTAASAGVVIGGWGFFTATAQSIAPRLPYHMRRAPLALFLTSATVNQIFIAFDIDSKPELLACIGQMGKKNNGNNQ